MARDITSGLQTETDSDSLSPILIFKAEFDSGDLNLWTGYGELIWNSDTYVGSGDLVEMSPIEESQTLSASGVTFELSGVDGAIISIAQNEDTFYRPITAWFAVLDSDGNLIADPYKVFSGKIDGLEWRDDGETAGVVISCEGDLIVLKRAKESRYTQEDQRSVYASDEGLDFVATSQDIELPWGAAT